MPAPCRKTVSGRVGSKARPPLPPWTGSPATQSSMPRSVLLRGPQRLAQVGGDVVGILEAYREADHVLADAGRLKLLRGHLLVRGAGRMDHQRLGVRSEEHTSELQSLMRISYAVFCLKNKN